MRSVFAVPLALAIACSAAPPADPVAPEPSTGNAATTGTVDNDAGAPPPVSDAGAPDAVATTDSAAPTDAAPVVEADGDSCPTGMVLVEGEYCKTVKHICEKSWFDKSNKKKVCEQFKDGYARCIGGKTKKRYCIDKYSWPNVKGERPEVMNNFYQAQVKCAAVGKRMCTESEWTLACEGPDMKPFPYGYKRDAKKCNGDHMWDGPRMKKVARRDPKELARLWKGVRSGSQPHCISDFGVHDLPANNDEVVSNESYNQGGIRAKFDSVHTGGPWYKGVRNQCRPKIYTHDEGFYYYFLGFRCCSEPDLEGKPDDPRTPWQRKRGWKFDRVERLARFNTKEMKTKLELKAAGKCSCRPTDRLCKTMCGTLLGPGAKDADPNRVIK